ncbi:MAG: M20 family metallopeptidase [Candidatus Aenigmatarchaeota archaeon]
MNEVELTQELIRINSENPPGNERGVARFIRDFLEGLKIPAEMIEFEKNRFDVVASVGSGRGIMLNGHMDTVPVGNNWKHDPFGGNVVNGKLYGRGASDMKGGIASILAAVQNLSKEKFKGKLLLTFVADEEANQKGSEYLIKNRRDIFKGIGYGVMADSNDMQITTAQKGIVQIVVGFRGKAAHASTPELGDNAIYKAAEFVLEIRKLMSNLGKTRNPVMGSGTASVGTIKGGIKVNVVPDFCNVEVDRRTIPGETLDYAINQIKEILKRLKLKADVQIKTSRMPMQIGENSEMVTLLKKISKAKTSSSPGYMETEMYFKELGIPCVDIGPGLDRQAHVADEYVPIKNLQKATNIYEKLIRRVCL